MFERRLGLPPDELPWPIPFEPFGMVIEFVLPKVRLFEVPAPELFPPELLPLAELFGLVVDRRVVGAPLVSLPLPGLLFPRLPGLLLPRLFDLLSFPPKAVVPVPVRVRVRFAEFEFESPPCVVVLPPCA